MHPQEKITEPMIIHNNYFHWLHIKVQEDLGNTKILEVFLQSCLTMSIKARACHSHHFHANQTIQ